ncbi:hypothetical protein [Burkholderia sp. DHOD12]|uniref:hypothetical protein n=1 Tax=Trinickia violacea TaxID=2571746 RepID=UPI001586A8C5
MANRAHAIPTSETHTASGGWHAAAELGASVTAAPSYWRAAPREHPHLFEDTRYGAR